MKKYLLFCAIIGFLGLKTSNATHIVGGEIFYDYIGNDSFKITLYLYMDCFNGSPEALRLDKEASIAIFRNSDNVRVDTFLVDSLQTEKIKGINYNCLVPPTNICVVKYSYEAYARLPDVAGGYTVVFQRCCRNKTILNVYDQDNTGGSYFTTINERSTLGNNSSPRFDNLPPNFICLNSPFEFKHSATDPNGDSLVYELCIPYAGGTPLDPVPRPPGPPPYSKIVLNTGFSINNFMNANPSLAIKAKTGLLTCTPRRLGQFVVGICVKEYRNGQLLSTVLRDFQFNVINCEFDVVSSFTMPEQSCEYKVEFKNESQGAIAYKWNFGDPTTKADSSDQKTVSYTYPKAGWYTVKLISYSKECSDTFYRDLFVKPDTGAFAGPDVRSCNGETVIIGPSNFFPRSKYKWYPSSFLNNDTARNPLASPPKKATYVLKQTFDYCFAYDTLQIEVGPPNVSFFAEALPECKNLTYKFTNTGEGSEFLWDFGTKKSKDISKKENTFFTYEKAGTYMVKFIAAVNPTCRDSVIQSIVVTEDTSSFAGYDRLSCFSDTVILGNAPMPPPIRYLWTPSATLSNANIARPMAFPTKTTKYYVKRFTDYCEVFDSVIVTVDKPEPFFKLAYTFPCDGLNVKVYNRSENCEKYLWDFGVSGNFNDTISTLDTVIAFKYPENGSYSINLKGTSNFGCVWNFAVPLNVFADTGKFAGPDSNICKGQLLQIGQKDSISFAKFRWSPPDSLSDYKIPQPIVNPFDTMVYVLSKIYPECTFTDTVVVGVHNPKSKFKTDYDPHCDLFKVSLINLTKRTDLVRWNFGFEVIESNADTVISTFPGSGNYTITVYALKQQCGDTFSRNFKAFIDTGVTIIPDSVICLSDSIFLGFEDTAKTAKHFWTPKDGLSSDSISNPLAYPKKTTTYTFTRSFEKCDYEGKITVRVANPKASFDTLVTPDCYGYNAEFTNTSTETERFKWIFSNGKNSLAQNENQLFNYGGKLKATLYAIDAHCVDSFSINKALNPFDSFKVIAPNVFTPNGDGYNDCFKIVIPKLPPSCKNFEMVFFNRWGQEMFTIEQEGNVLCWDGNYVQNGKPVNEGVYFYIVKVLDRQINGTVHIIR